MVEAEGRSYLIRAGNAALAQTVARRMARDEGHPSPEAPALFVERIEAGLYEVVIEVSRLYQEVIR